MDRSIARRLGLAAVGTGVGTGLAVALARRPARGPFVPFYEERGQPSPGLAAGPVHGRLPVVFHRSDGFGSVHTASYDAVRGVLPSDALYPVRLPDGRALVSVAAYRHHETTDSTDATAAAVFPAYAELFVNAYVTLHPMPMARRAALLAGIGYDALDVFVLHLPVTHRPACEAGRVLWGMPKFVADMEFDDDGESRSVRVSEADEHILTLTVHRGGRVAVNRAPTSVLTVLDGRLLRTTMPSVAYEQPRRAGATLTLGAAHSVAEDLRRLEVSPQAIASVTTLDARVMIPEGAPIGEAHEWPGYAGMSREFGRYTVRYPGTGPIDQYATVRATVETAGVPKARRKSEAVIA